MPRVIHFEIGAQDVEKLQQFYGKTFGWQFTKIRAPVEYWMVRTGDESEPGSDGGMFRKSPLMGARNVIGVPVLEDYTSLIIKNGGTIVIPRIRVPGIGRIAVFRDPEGNEFGLLEAELPEEPEQDDRRSLSD